MIPSIVQMATTTISLISFCILGVSGVVTGIDDHNGTLVFRTDMQIGASIGGMMLSSEDFTQHEYGHIKQQEQLGIFYIPVIVLPSVINATMLSLGLISYYDYMDTHPERWANELGGL